MHHPLVPMISRSVVVATLLLPALAFVGCSSNASPGGGSGGASSPGSGGSSQTGSGGASSGTGGKSGTGGATGSGGASSGGQSGTGGSNGTGGNSGTGGSTGSGTGGAAGAGGTPAAGSGGSGPGAGGGTGVTPFLTEDFESGTVGKQPTGWDNFIGYVKNAANPQGDTLALVDSMHAHGGKNAVHIHGGSSPAMITRALPTGTNKLYVRAYFYMSRQLGMNPNANHETLIGIRKAAGSANDEVRFGEIKGVIGTNEVPSDNISPKMDKWGMGPVVAANTWACIEVAFLADQPQHTLQAWADGTLVHSITAPDQWQNGTLPMDWMKGKFVEVILGWHSFSNATNDIWMDDLVLSTGPIGCK